MDYSNLLRHQHQFRQAKVSPFRSGVLKDERFCDSTCGGWIIRGANPGSSMTSSRLGSGDGVFLPKGDPA